MRDVYPPPWGMYTSVYPPDSGVQDSPFSVSIPACKESRVRQPGASGFCYRASVFCSLPDGQVLFFWEIQITEGLLSILPIKKGFGAS